MVYKEPRKEPRAISVEASKDLLKVALADGRVVSVPLEWFPVLRDATAKKRNNWRLIGNGVGAPPVQPYSSQG